MDFEDDELDESIIYWCEMDDGEFILIEQGEDQILMNRSVAINLAKTWLKNLIYEEVL